RTASPSTPVVPTIGTASPTTPVAPHFPSSSPPEVENQHQAADEEGPQLLGQQPCWISGGKIDPGSASRYITTLVHTHIPRPVDAWREFPMPVWDLLFDMFTQRYVFTRPKDLPRARAVWESTAQTNLRKLMYEARDKAMKTTCNRDPMAWLDYGPVWLRRDYWESLCERWATGPWQSGHRRQNATDQLIQRRMCILVGPYLMRPTTKNCVTSLSVPLHFASYLIGLISGRGRMTMLTRVLARLLTMVDRYAKSTPQPDLDPEAWVDATGEPRMGRVYGFGDSLDTTLVLSSYASSVAPPAYASSSAAQPDSGVEEMRTLIREELQAHFGEMVEQLISAMQEVCPSQPTPQVSITINFT
ncbi:hypothetical protein Taro_024560, partial [Colocasia esculenta]|nr:hypothetical protein [Colocasia esculenta]